MKAVCRSLVVALALPALLALAAGHPVVARQNPAAQALAGFDVRDVMIPARDGVRLHTKIFIPKDARDPLPFILERTPYGVDEAGSELGSSLKELADDGYIFVFQDIRGRFRSEGTFVMQRPARAPGDAKAIDEGTDAYDTIEWLLTNVQPNNGRVGMLGVSYDGWTTAMATLEPAPGAEGRLAPGLARRHVARRRLPSQRRVPPELRVRIRRA